jgi:hypothetical protein
VQTTGLIIITGTSRSAARRPSDIHYKSNAWCSTCLPSLIIISMPPSHNFRLLGTLGCALPFWECNSWSHSKLFFLSTPKIYILYLIIMWIFFWLQSTPYKESYSRKACWLVDLESQIHWSECVNTCHLFSLWFYSPLDLGRFFSLLIYTQSVGLLLRGISPSQGRYLHTGQHEHRINAHTHIYVLSGIRIHDPSVREVEDGSCFRPRGSTVIYTLCHTPCFSFCFFIKVI